MLSKKGKRLLSKKRKIEAFLDLAVTDEPDQKKICAESSVEVQKPLGAMGQMILTDEELAELRSKLREKQKSAMEMPKLFLTLDEMKTASSSDAYYLQSSDKTPVLYPSDVQHLLLYALQGNLASYKPRWCQLLRWQKLSHVVVVVIESASAADLVAFPGSFQFINDGFPMRVEVVSPSQYGRSFAEELFCVPMSTRQFTRNHRQNAENNSQNDGTFQNSAFASSSLDRICGENENADSSSSAISRLDLMLNEEQMKIDSYPIPIMNLAHTQNYKYSKAVYSRPSDRSSLFAVDCEMVRTTAKNEELVWVSIVDENLSCVYESYVKPQNPIVDYLTRFSGVSKSTLENVMTCLNDVQEKISSLLPSDAILVGQSLNNDLHALQMLHPYVIDTSVIYNLSGIPYRKPALKRLASAFLRREIQTGNSGHNPREDAVATMELVKLKLKHGFEFGNVLNGWTVTSANDDASIATPGQPPSPDVASVANGSNSNGASDDVTRDISDGRSIVSSSCESSAILRRSSFFRRTNYQSLFELAKRSNRTVAVAGFEKRFTDGAVVLEAETDKAIARQTSVAVDDNFMVCSKFTSVTRELVHSDRCSRCLQRALEDVDKKVKRIVKKLKQNCLVTVILSGRTESNETQNGVCFVKIT